MGASENNGDTLKLAIQMRHMINDDNKLGLRVFCFRTDPNEKFSVAITRLLQPTIGQMMATVTGK